MVHEQFPPPLEERRVASQFSWPNPIENLWTILADRVDKLGQVNTIENLIQNLKLDWIGIDADILNNLVGGMPGRIRKVMELHGDYISQWNN